MPSSKYAQLGEEDIEKDFYELMRIHSIAPSRLKMLLCHKDCEKDIAPWNHTSTYEMKTLDGHWSTYSCILSYRTGCKCTISITYLLTLLVLEHSRMHHACSHDNDISK